jgi:nicotinamide mononucleotide transporter
VASVIIFLATFVFVWGVYAAYGKFNHWTSYVDTLTTAIFFVGMWLMAKRKIENWIYWIVGDIITVPLYFYKGLTFSSILYFVLTIIAIYGYFAWKKLLNNNQVTA